MLENERRVLRALVSRQGRSFEEKSYTKFQTEAAKMSFEDFVRSPLPISGPKFTKFSLAELPSRKNSVTLKSR